MSKRRKLLILKRLCILLSASVVFLGVCAFSLASLKDKLNKRDTVVTQSQEQEEIVQQVEKVEPQITTITISSAGDFTLGTDENFNYSTSFNKKYEDEGPDYFLKNVKDIFTQDDLTLVNLEGTLTTASKRQDKQFAFKGKPEYAKMLASASIEAVNLANNHTYDYGEQSYQDTIKNVEDTGVKTFGYTRNYVYEVKGIKIGLIGANALGDPTAQQSQILKNIETVKNEGAQLIILSIHWGVEKSQIPTDIQKQFAHKLIDNGVDLILGTHPHVLQGIEQYKGKNIVYSLGNFCYGGHSNPSDKDTMIFQQTFTFEDGVLKSDNTTNIIPCSISSVSTQNDYSPTPSSGEEKERIMNKIQKLSEGL